MSEANQNTTRLPASLLILLSVMAVSLVLLAAKMFIL
jgi:hypothetical protein